MEKGHELRQRKCRFCDYARLSKFSAPLCCVSAFRFQKCPAGPKFNVEASKPTRLDTELFPSLTKVLSTRGKAARLTELFVFHQVINAGQFDPRATA